MVQAKLIFTDDTMPTVLRAFNKRIENGIIVDKNGEPVLVNDWEELAANDFAGIKKGSEIYIKKDLPSIIELAEGEI